MALKQYKPTSPGQRQLVTVERDGLWKGKPEKSLTEGLSKNGGRNSDGRITVRHRGGGHKRRYRLIDFKRRKWDMKATVERIEYDPNRTAHIALIKYQDGELAYILAPQKLVPGAVVEAGANVDVQPGNAMPLKNMPVGTIIHNIELKPGAGGKLIRSAGAFAQLAGRDQAMAQIKLTSGEVRLVPVDCMASVGAVSNPDQRNISLAKAGRKRWLGVRPTTRGIAMNPVDHPHGGRANGGTHWVTPWGQGTKGKKTRKNKATDKFIVRRRTAKK